MFPCRLPALEVGIFLMGKNFPWVELQHTCFLLVDVNPLGTKLTGQHSRTLAVVD